MLQGFKQFILRGNVVDLATAVVIGGAFGKIVDSLVKGFVTPLIGAIGGQPDYSNLFFTVNGNKFLYGDLLNAIISFLLIATVVYFFIVVPTNKLISLSKTKESPDPATKKCPFCYSEVSIKATKCAFCTSDLKEKK